MERHDETNVPLNMNKKIIILLCIIAVISLIALLSLKPKQQTQPFLATQPQITNSVVRGSTTQQNSTLEQPDGTNILTTKDIGFKPTTKAEANAKIREMLEARNKPVEVWGKVVDQDKASLSGVRVEAEIGHFEWPPEQYPNGVTTKQETTTDANGQFHIQDNAATGVGVMLQKDGYEQESPKGNGYALGDGGGTRENPIILRMWGTNVLQKLITGDKQFHIIPDGRSYFINLNDGTISESGKGDLKVSVRHPEQPEQGQFYAWSCEIDVANGGLLEELDDSSMYIAPEEGYVPSFQSDQQIKGNESGSIGNKRFYLMLKNGHQYGRMQIDLIAPYSRQIPGLLRLSYAINPSGSRILR